MRLLASGETASSTSSETGESPRIFDHIDAVNVTSQTGTDISPAEVVPYGESKWTIKRPFYAKKFGKATILNGYEVALSSLGFDGLGPIMSFYNETPAEILEKYVANGWNARGVMIFGDYTPLLQIHSDDPQIRKRLEPFWEGKSSRPIMQIAPTLSIPFRTNASFPSLKSRVFIDPKGPKHPDAPDAVMLTPARHYMKIVGAEAAWPAFDIDPVTQAPFRWLDKRGPHNVSQRSLPEIDHKGALDLIDQFERHCVEQGQVDLQPCQVLDERGPLSGTYGQGLTAVLLKTDSITARIEWLPSISRTATSLGVAKAIWRHFLPDERSHVLPLWHVWSLTVFGQDPTDLFPKLQAFCARRRSVLDYVAVEIVSSEVPLRSPRSSRQFYRRK